MRLELDFDAFCKKLKNANSFSSEAKTAMFEYLQDHPRDLERVCCECVENDLCTVRSDYALEGVAAWEVRSYLRDHTLVASDDPLVYVPFVRWSF